MTTRTNVTLPDDLFDAARAAGLNVSALASQAIAAELDRRARLAAAYAWLDKLDAEHGTPTPGEQAAAEQWAERVLNAPLATELSQAATRGTRVDPSRTIRIVATKPLMLKGPDKQRAATASKRRKRKS